MEKWKDRKIAELAYNLNLFDVEEILDVAIKQMPAIINAQRISIYMLDPEEKNFISKRHSSQKIQDNIVEKIPVDSRSSLIPQIMVKNMPLLVPNVQEYIEKNGLDITLSKHQKYSSGSCMLIPLKLKLPNDHEKLLGVINFAEKMDFSSFTKQDLVLAEHVGEIVAAAIHNCTVIEKKLGGRQKELMSELDKIKDAYAQKDIKLDEAKKRQNQMLPDLPKIPGYSIDVHYSPMETIGGDFYDFIPIKENEIGIVVGDVSGHGIEAALVMSMSKQILRIYSKLYGTLTETLLHANDEICANLNGESFVAVFLGILNTETHVLRYARAGQTYPMVYNPSRRPDLFELKSDGVVLGTVRGEIFRSKIEEKCFQLSSGDVMLLYTDGVIEAANPKGDDFSVERLTESLKKLYPKTSTEIVSSLHKEVEEHLQGPQTDDITLLCLKAENIKPKGCMDTQRVQKLVLAEAESFIVSPEFSYDEEVHYQMVGLEEKIAELETQIQELQHEKLTSEEKCQELNLMMDMATNDPDSLIHMLREQLKVALELPKDMIVENERLHKELEKQKQDLRALELEVNDWMHNAELLKKKSDELTKKNLEIEAKLTDANKWQEKLRKKILADILNNSMYFDPPIMEQLKNEEFHGALEKLENLLNIAFEQMDMATLLSLQKQLYTICRSFFNQL